MAKILIQDNHSSFWFERLSVISYYTETEFEKRLIDQSSMLFANYFVVPFKKTISLTSDSSRTTTPDLVFIKKDYTSWILVEVELKGHTIKHVSDQVEVMLKPSFNKPEIIKYLLGQNEHVLDPVNFSFDEPKLTSLISNIKAEVMVIVDQTALEWETEFDKKKVKVCVIQAYKNADTEVILRIKGQFPQIYTGSVHCRKAKDVPNGIEIINDHELLDSLQTDDLIEIYLNERLTRWKAIRSKRTKKLFLKCMGSRFPLEPKRDFVLKFDEGKQVYLFEKN